jgi:hypothetical protein
VRNAGDDLRGVAAGLASSRALGEAGGVVSDGITLAIPYADPVPDFHHALACFDYLFDSVEGAVGLRGCAGGKVHRCLA